MSSSNRRVVITGIGAVNPLGLNASEFWAGLERGQSSIHLIKGFDASPLPTRFAGEIVGFDVKNYIAKENKEGRKSIRVMARTIQLAVAAAQLCIDDARIDKSRLDPTRFGVEFGAGLIATELPELGPASQVSTNGVPGKVDLAAWGTQGLEAIPPLWMLKYLPNMLACHVSILHDAQGPNNSITEGDAASLLALGEACRILRRNQADFFLVGGGDSKINALTLVRQSLFGRMSTQNEAPEKAVRPFDRQRNGIAFGEGAAVLAREDLEHAQRRGAVIYGEVLGFGAAFDRGLTGKGVARAIRAALVQAQVQPEAIDHVNAHGLGSVTLDAFEARGIHEVFGSRKKPVTVWSLKSIIGNLSAASGTTELGASLLAMKHGVLPGTLNFAEPDPACPVAVSATPRAIGSPYFLKVGYTELGQCAAVVCRKWES